MTDEIGVLRCLHSDEDLSMMVLRQDVGPGVVAVVDAFLRRAPPRRRLDAFKVALDWMRVIQRDNEERRLAPLRRVLIKAAAESGVGTTGANEEAA